MCRVLGIFIATLAVSSSAAVAQTTQAADCDPWDLCSNVVMSSGAQTDDIWTSDPFWIWPAAQEVELELSSGPGELDYLFWTNSTLRLLDAEGTIVPGSEIVMCNDSLGCKRLTKLLSVASGQYRLQLEPSHGTFLIGHVNGGITYNRALPRLQSPKKISPWTSDPFDIGPGTQEVELSLDTVFPVPMPSILWQNSRLQLLRSDTKAMVGEVVLCPNIDWAECGDEAAEAVAACLIGFLCNQMLAAFGSCLAQHALECTAPVTTRVTVEPGAYVLNLEPSHGTILYGDVQGTALYNRELDPADERCHPRDVFLLDAGNKVNSLIGNLEFPGDHDWQRIHPTESGLLRLILRVPAGKDYDFELRDASCMPLIGFPPSTNPAGQSETFAPFVNADNDLWVHTFPKNNSDFNDPYTVTAIVNPKPPVLVTGPWLTGPVDKGPAYGPGRYQVTFSDPDAGLETLSVERDQYCHTCVTNLDGSTCDGVISVYGSKSPLCSIVSWQPFAAGTQDPVVVTVKTGPDAYQDPNWYFGAKIVATSSVGLTNFSNEWHELLPPTCQVDLLGATAAGGHPWWHLRYGQQRWTYTVQDAPIQNSLGLYGVAPTQLTNCQVSVPNFVEGTQDPVVATVTQGLPGWPAASAVNVIDLNGNAAVCDPVTVMVGHGIPLGRTFARIREENHVVNIRNGAPGLSSVVIVVNNVRFKAIRMDDGAPVSLDIAAAMQPGDGNTIVVIANGRLGSNAAITFTREPLWAP